MKKMKGGKGKRGREDKKWEKQAAKPRYRKPSCKGPKPNYEPKGGVMTKKELTFVYNTSARQLLNGVMDKGVRYKIGDAEFEKEMVPPFKGAQESDFRCAVRFIGATEGHELLLSGVQPGTHILASTLSREDFFSKVKNAELQRSLAALHKYLRRRLVAETSQEKAAVANPEPVVKLTDEPLFSDPRLIWEGKTGLVELNGVKFRVSVEEKGGHQFPVVRVYFAPHETELFDLSGAGTYVTVGKLRNPKFLSPFKEGSGFFEKQKRIWDFLRGEFAKVGITEGAVKAKPVSATVLPATKVAVAKPEEDHYKGSKDIGQFVSGFYGDYVLGEPGARALIRVRSHTNKASGNSRTVVELVKCDGGNPLRGECKPTTHIPHSWLGRDLEQINIVGFRAPDMTMLYIYLTEVIETHRKEMYASMVADKKLVRVTHTAPKVVQ